MYKQYKRTDSNKKPHNWYDDWRYNGRIYINLTSLERYEGNGVLFRLFKRLLRNPTLACPN